MVRADVSPGIGVTRKFKHYFGATRDESSRVLVTHGDDAIMGEVNPLRLGEGKKSPY